MTPAMHALCKHDEEYRKAFVSLPVVKVVEEFKAVKFPKRRRETTTEKRPYSPGSYVDVPHLPRPCQHLGSIVTYGDNESRHVYQCNHDDFDSLLTKPRDSSSWGLCRRGECQTLQSCLTCKGYVAAPLREAPSFWDRAVCINLDRRPDRWKQFQDGCPIPVERIAAADGSDPPEPKPKWWRAGSGAWGCYLSHMGILRKALEDGFDVDDKVLLVFEDDAIFADDFMDRLPVFWNALPPQWDQVYLGGEHRNLSRKPLGRVNNLVARAKQVNRTHGYAVRGMFIRIMYEHLSDLSDHRRTPRFHIDHRMELLHQKHRVYAPWRWLIGQGGGRSDIANRVFTNRFWSVA